MQANPGQGERVAVSPLPVPVKVRDRASRDARLEETLMNFVVYGGLAYGFAVLTLKILPYYW